MLHLSGLVDPFLGLHVGLSKPMIPMLELAVPSSIPHNGDEKLLATRV